MSDSRAQTSLRGSRSPWWILLAASLALFIACGGAEDAVSEAPATDPSPSLLALQVVEAKAHVLPGGHGVIYFRVHNGPTEDRLLAVETPLAERAELHQTVDEDGVMRMRPQADGFVVPAAGSLVLEPGGRHVMLMGVVLPPDSTTPLTLHFAQAGAMEIVAEVLGVPGADGEMDHGEMDHGEMDHGEMDHGEMDHGEMDDSEVEQDGGLGH